MDKQKKSLQIGWAIESIAPDRPAVLAGQFYGRTSKYAGDPITATALVLTDDDGVEQAVMVSIDAVAVREYTQKIAMECIATSCPQVNPKSVMINAIHTHSAPVQYPSPYAMPDEVIGDKEYSELLGAQIAAAVKAAWDSRKRGRVGWGLAHAAFAHNRISLYSDGTAKMYGETAKEEFRGFQAGEESAVQLIFTTDENDVLTGMVVNVACPSQCTEHSDFITADYWADTRTELRARHGDGLFILPQCAAAGDISPHLRRNKPAEERMLRLMGLLTGEVDRTQFEMGRRRLIARRIANAVDEALSLVRTDMRDEVEFAHRQQTIQLPKREVTEELRDAAAAKIAQHKQEMAKLDPDADAVEYAMQRSHIMRSETVIDRYTEQLESPCLAMDLHTIRLGDIALITNQFELYHDYEARIESRSNALQTFVIQLTGHGSYLPTRRAMTGVSYGAGIESNLVGPDGGDVLVEESVKAINEMFEE